MTTLDNEQLVTVFEHDGLCIEGTEEQVDIHAVLDNIPRMAARKLETDDPLVQAAHDVCMKCVQLTVCTEASDKFMDDVTVSLPRRVENAAVIGDNLLKIDGIRSLEEIEIVDTTKPGLTAAATGTELYDSSVKGRLKTELEREVYEYLVYGNPSGNFLEKMRYWIMEGGTRNDSGFFDTATKALTDRQDYGRNHAQSERFKQLNHALRGNINSGIFSHLEPVFFGEKKRHNIEGGNQRRIQVRRDAYLRDGLCFGEASNASTTNNAQKRPSELMTACVVCPVFVDCGVSSLFESTKASVSTRAGITKSVRGEMRREYGAERLARVLKSEVFPVVETELAEVYAVYQEDLRPVVEKGRYVTGEYAVERPAVDKVLRKKVVTILRKHDPANKK